MKMNKLFPFLLIVIFGVLFCSGCSGEKKTAEFKVGVVAVTSGELFRKGNYIISAARYGADLQNKSGGLALAGQEVKVRLFPADSNGKPEIAAKVTRRLIEKDKVSAIVGAAGSKVALAVGRSARSLKFRLLPRLPGQIS